MNFSFSILECDANIGIKFSKYGGQRARLAAVAQLEFSECSGRSGVTFY
jgi:hypothetical protein